MDYQDQARFGMNEPDDEYETIECLLCEWVGTWGEATPVLETDDNGVQWCSGYICPKCGAELDED